MSSRGIVSGFSKLQAAPPALASLLALVLLFGVYPQSLIAQDQPALAQAAPSQPYTQQTPEQLQQLVAPIALYPDSLVAQILAASTFPEQVVEADRWVQSHPDLKGEALAQAVDQEPWDPSVKALAAFPSVLGNMDKNLSWTSSLGDAYYNEEQGVMDAVQVMRRRAQQAGNLNSTPQQNITTEGSAIQIVPVNPEIVYVPAYDPWIVYGGPLVAWPGWYPYPGIWYPGPALYFGPGFGIGFFGGYGWGWGHWGFDWHNHYAVYDHARYYSHSRTFYNRNEFYRGGGDRGAYDRGGRAQPFGGDRGAARGYAEPHGQSGDRGVAGGITEPRGQSGDRGAAGGYTEPRGQSGERGAAGGYTEPRGQSGDRGAAGGYTEPRGQSGDRGAAGGYTEPRGQSGDRGAAGGITEPRGQSGDRGATGGYTEPRGQSGDRGAAGGYAAPRDQSGVRSGAFSSYGRGGEERSYSSRGSASFGGGGSRGGGGFQGGGGRGGGHR